MITPPTNWDTLWADPESKLLVSVRIYLTSSIVVEYTNSDLISCELDGSLFKDLSIGNVCSSRLRIVVKDDSDNALAFKSGQKVNLRCRLQKTNTITSYVQQGNFFLFSVTANNDNSLEIIAYDALYYVQDGITQSSYSTASTYLSSLWYMYNTGWTSKLSSYTLLDNSGLTSSASSNAVSAIRLPQATKSIEARKVLQTVSTLAGGNMALDKQNNIRMYRLGTGPTITDTPEGIVVTAESINRLDKPYVITGVDLRDESNVYASGSGWRIPAYIDGAASIVTPSINVAEQVARNMHSDLSGDYPERVSIRASDVRVDGALINPIFELGDIASVDIGNGKYYNFQICDYSVNYAGGCWGYIGCPVSGDAAKFSIENTWSSTSGWEEGWTTCVISSESYSIDVLAKNVFRLNPDRIVIVNAPAGKNLVKITGGLSPISVSFQYVSTQDGQTKSISVSAYIINEYFPLENDNGTQGGYLSDLVFCCASLPDDAIGAAVIGRPIVLQSDQIGGTVSAKLSTN